MQIQVNVNQVEAFKRGVNAPSSTARIEVDPSTLPTEVREFIASKLKEGYRLDFHSCGFGSVNAPTIDGLVERAHELMAAEAEAKAARTLARAEYSAKAVANPESCVSYHPYTGATLTGFSSCVTESPYNFRVKDAKGLVTPEAFAALTAVAERARREYEEKEVAEKVAAEKAKAEAEAAKTAKEKKKAAERQKIIDFLRVHDPELCERYEKNYVTREYVVRRVNEACRKALGVDFTGDGKEWGADDLSRTSEPNLSSEEYKTLKAWLEKMPNAETPELFLGETKVEDREDDPSEEPEEMLVAQTTFPHPELGWSILADIRLR